MFKKIAIDRYCFSTLEVQDATEKVAINALPNVDYLVAQLSSLIENPEELKGIGKRARAFVEKEHDYLKIAKKYLAIWDSNG